MSQALETVTTELPVAVAAPTLDTLLLSLSKWGKPRVSLVGPGWYCVVDMNTSIVGAEFKVASDFSHTSPTAAALQCRDRMQTALKNIGAQL